MSSDITLVVADLDGTLLERDESMIRPVRGLKAALESHGVDFTLASGRVAESALPHAERLGVTLPFITSNGATVMTSAGVVSTHLVPALGLREVVEMALSCGISVVYTLDGREFPMTETSWVLDQQRRFGRYLEVRDLDHAGWETAEFEKVMFMDGTRDGRIAGVEDAVRALGDPYTYTRYVDRAVEVIAAGHSKATALAEVLSMTGHSAAATLAIGDHQNDLEMFSVVGYSGAVGNAIPAVRGAAGYTSSATHGYGVLDIVERLLGIRVVA